MRDPLHPAAGQVPPLPANAVGAGHITGPTRRLDQHALDHPVHVHVLWSDGVIDERDGWAVEWNATHVRVHYWGRGSERWTWFAARDVRRRAVPDE